MMMKRLSFCCLALAPVPALAQPFQDLAAVERDVADFTGVALGQPGGATRALDRRLRLAPCRNPLTLSWYGSRRDTIAVQCPDAGGWRLFVPVLLSAESGPPVVTRGEAVEIEVNGPGFTVSEAGEAMDAGAVGSWIRVRTVSGNSQPLRAKVLRPGHVALETGSDNP